MKGETHSLKDLNQLYSDADQCDQDHFSEQRSNVLLIAGEHYSKKNSKFWNRVRDQKNLSQEQKLRLTKNHIQKITKTYVNNIISHAPSVTPVPKNEKELQDQKAAELNKSVWQDAKNRHNLRGKTQQWAKDYVDLGEVAVKIFWNPSKGRFLGYSPEMDEAGNPVMDESGQMVASKTPVFSGDFEFERIWAFNLLRDPNAKSMEDSNFLIIRKMVDVKALKSMVAGDEDKEKAIVEHIDETFMVFDGNQNSYGKSDGQTLLKEFYFKPCHQYPMGYYYICVEGAILFEGELPFGVFPIVYEGFDEVQTSARHKSIVKHLRPYQAEVNRAASKIAEHQVTLGDDKLLVQSGTKVTNGGHLPGVRTLQFSGMAPTVLSGRSGDQYVGYMDSQISEMYSIANVNEDSIQKDVKLDPFGSLFSSLRQKKKFTIYGEKFEDFLIKVCKTYLELAKHYLPDDMLIPAIGRNEYINISEFRTTTELNYSIKIEPMSDDLETLMGRQLAINHTLQYVGNNLEKEDIGKLIRAMPLGNFEENFSDFTLDYDSSVNMILALDRGEAPQPNKYDNAEYMIKKLVGRSRQSDFTLLNPQIQANYQNMIALYEQIVVQRRQEMQMAQSQFIPSGGARIKVDYYVPDPNNASRTVRATLPAESVDWLIKKLADQGSAQEQLAIVGEGAASEIAGRFNQLQGTALGASGAMPQAMGLVS